MYFRFFAGKSAGFRSLLTCLLALAASPVAASPAGWSALALLGATGEAATTGIRVQARADSEDGACFFPQANFQGRANCFGIDRMGRMPNSLIFGFRSFQLLGNASLTLCTGQDFTGRCQRFDSAQQRFDAFQSAQYRSMAIEVPRSNQGAATPPPLPPGAENETCIYSQRAFAGQATCFDANSRQMRPAIGSVQSISISPNAYTYLCDRPNFQGNCVQVRSNLADIEDDFSPFRNGSLITFPFARSPRMNTPFTLIRDVNRTVSLIPNQPNRQDLEVTFTEQGLTLRPGPGAFMYVLSDGTAGVGQEKLTACEVRQHIRGTPAQYVLASMMQRRAKQLCIYTSDYKFVLLEVEEFSNDWIKLNTAISR